MPKRVITLIICSFCGREDREDEGFNEVITIEIIIRGVRYNVEVCEACEHEHVAPITEKAVKLTPAKKSKPKPKDVPVFEFSNVNGTPTITATTGPDPKLKCDVCEHVAKAPQGKGAHMRSAHGIGAKSKEKVAS